MPGRAAVHNLFTILGVDKHTSVWYNIGVKEREVIHMATYTVYLGSHPIANVDGGEAAYVCYEAAKTIAEMTCRTALLVDNETGEEVAEFDPNELDEEVESWDEPDADEMGFDPYEGCYTWDC